MAAAASPCRLVVELQGTRYEWLPDRFYLNAPVPLLGNARTSPSLSPAAAEAATMTQRLGADQCVTWSDGSVPAGKVIKQKPSDNDTI